MDRDRLEYRRRPSLLLRFTRRGTLAFDRNCHLTSSWERFEHSIRTVVQNSPPNFLCYGDRHGKVNDSIRPRRLPKQSQSYSVSKNISAKNLFFLRVGPPALPRLYSFFRLGKLATGPRFERAGLQPRHRRCNMNRTLAPEGMQNPWADLP